MSRPLQLPALQSVQCQALACKPHESSKIRHCRTLMARVRTYRFTGTRLSGSAAVIQRLSFKVHAVLPRVPRFITVLPLCLSLDHKSSALPGLVLKVGTVRGSSRIHSHLLA